MLPSSGSWPPVVGSVSEVAGSLTSTRLLSSCCILSISFLWAAASMCFCAGLSTPASCDNQAHTTRSIRLEVQHSRTRRQPPNPRILLPMRNGTHHGLLPKVGCHAEANLLRQLQVQEGPEGERVALSAAAHHSILQVYNSMGHCLERTEACVGLASRLGWHSHRR